MVSNHRMERQRIPLFLRQTIPKTTNMKALIIWIFRWIFRKNKWTLNDSIRKEHDLNRCVMTAAPHTTNWDLVYCLAAFDMMQIPVKFTIKKEWFKFPLNLAIGPMGGIPIDRSPKSGGLKKRSMVDAMADLFEQREELCVLVTPEGTRKKRDKWRTGFYHTALKANVPIAIGYLDYAKREAGIADVFYPTGDINEDMKRLNRGYVGKTPKHPELFSFDKRYLP